jgi:hypothetical protein
MPDERATVTRERYRNANVIAGYIRPCVKYFTHGRPHVGVRQLLTGNRSNKGVSMNGNSEENKDHVELTEKSAQQWLKIRRYTPVRDGDVSEQGLKEVGGDGTPSTGADSDVPPR